jgi:hypothetical protein
MGSKPPISLVGGKIECQTSRVTRYAADRLGPAKIRHYGTKGRTFDARFHVEVQEDFFQLPAPLRQCG